MRKMLLTTAIVLVSACAQAAGSLGVTLASADDPVAAEQSTTTTEAATSIDRPYANSTTAPAATTTTPAPATSQAPAAATGPATQSHPQTPLVRHCTTLGGKSFTWSFPNVPFGVASCS